MEPRGTARRPTAIRSIVTALAALPLLAACGAAPAPPSTAPDDGAGLSQDELTKAEAVARQEVADQEATVSSATVVERRGEVTDSNTGHPCTSGRELRIKLIGDFPHIVTTGHPVLPGSPPPDFTVRAMVITADAESGLACLIGVQTAEDGEPKPLPGGASLSVG